MKLKYLHPLAIALMVFLVFPIGAMAHDLEIVVVDYNTLDAIGNATVKIYNDTDLLAENLTNQYGFVNFSLSSWNYTILTTKESYDGDNRDLELVSDDSLLIKLMPESPEGLIRFRYVDLTGIKIGSIGENHQICVYYLSNNRLHDCYLTNETIQLTEQLDYIIRITPTRQDMLNSPENLGVYVNQYMRYFIVFLFIVSGITVVLYVEKRFIFGRA